MEYALKSTANIQAVQFVNDLDENNENIPLRLAVEELGLKEAWKDRDHPFNDATIFDGENKMSVPYKHFIAKTEAGYVVLSPDTMKLFEPVGDVAKEIEDELNAGTKTKKTK